MVLYVFLSVAMPLFYALISATDEFSCFLPIIIEMSMGYQVFKRISSRINGGCYLIFRQ